MNKKYLSLLFMNNLTDKKLFNKFGRKSYIRNGVGFGFISDEYLYDNCFIEIGIGRVKSGYGDWGGGFSYTETSPLKITIDKDFIIQKIETESFYNNKSSQITEKIAKLLSKKLKIGHKFIIKDKVFMKHVKGILNFIPCKAHIGHDVFNYPHMLENYIAPENKDYYYFRDPLNRNKFATNKG